jgi:hypothetical protein
LKIFRIPAPHRVLSHHTPNEGVPSLLQDGEDEKKFKTVTGNIRKTATYNWNQKYQRHLKYVLSLIFLSLQPQWPRDCSENPAP